MQTDITNTRVQCLELPSAEMMKVTNYAQFIRIQSEYMWRAHIKSIMKGWTVRESNPGGGEIFHAHPD